MRDGFAGTSMADIIGEADSSAGSVYSNFENKSELVRYAASRALRDLNATVAEELPSERTPASVLAHLLESSDDRAHAQTLLQIWAEVPRAPELAEIGRQSVLELRAFVQAALLPWCRDRAHSDTTAPDAAADALADAVLTAVQGYLVRITLDRDVDTKMLATRIVEVFAHL